MSRVISRFRRSVLPARLPFILSSYETLMESELKQSSHRPFRRLYFKRMLSSGDYEDDWQQIAESRIIQWGKISRGADHKKINFWDQSGVTLVFDNSDGFFSDENYWQSFWYATEDAEYLGRNRTLVRIQAGYEFDTPDSTVELPEETTIFTGYIDAAPKVSFENKVTFQVKAMSTVFNDVSAGDLPVGSLATNTASEFIMAARDYQDSNGVYVFRKFFSTTAWDVPSTTTKYLYLTTQTSLDNMSVFQMIQKFAEAEGRIAYVSGAGNFRFVARNVTSTVSRHYVGGARFYDDQAHTIISIDKFEPSYDKVYNRVQIKFNTASTATSYRTIEESWAWGDSSSSFKYGVKTFPITNQWLDTASADTLATNLFNEFRYPKDEIEFEAKFVPDAEVLQAIQVSYNNQSDETGIWGSSVWGGFRYNPAETDHLYFAFRDFVILNIEHDLDKFSTSIYARALAD